MTDEFLISRRRMIITGGALLLTPAFMPLSAALAAENVNELVNKVRRQYGAPPMQPEEKLEKAALYQARLMAKHGKIGHSIGWGNSFGGRLKQAGIRGPAAENVASGQKDVPDALTAWLNSAGHRKNLLDPLFTRYGLAYAARAEKPHYLYWAMLYGI
ncbi:CAP domain-containing protein [Pseudochrobactrum sp. sp1633]|uniref:CAP domain-containing protein n=1 Tax=Pseudochrobactrum sp. sp1633 TaxID=3036706 RepID=UPI0025A56D58|nr:CAP domain-containing protein [Pseudochrobactrum sp. sp1633]MDM8346489.1 CAP domain-containing protein [Pseudochrobactrum sp. sp1633]HWD12705.1 CAP domain-containing protein [Pseudochrobactrum sp.]